MTQILEYTVTGSGPFPIDMLRYDSAWPKSEMDSHLVSMTRDNEGYFRPRTVTLETWNSPDRAPIARVTPERWESFGWKVNEAPHG